MQHNPPKTMKPMQAAFSAVCREGELESSINANSAVCSELEMQVHKLGAESSLYCASSGASKELHTPDVTNHGELPPDPASVIKGRVHTVRETARDTRNDIVEVKNLSGCPQHNSPGS